MGLFALSSMPFEPSVEILIVCSVGGHRPSKPREANSDDAASCPQLGCAFGRDFEAASVPSLGLVGSIPKQPAGLKSRSPLPGPGRAFRNKPTM